jgi:hypothetical protein
LNYELDLYTEALDQFPMKAEYLRSAKGNATLIKIDIFKKFMYYSMEDKKGRFSMLTLTPQRVAEVHQLNKKGVIPDEIEDAIKSGATLEPIVDFEDVTGGVELKDAPKNKRRKSRKNRSRSGGPSNQQSDRRNNPNQKPRRKPKK